MTSATTSISPTHAAPRRRSVGSYVFRIVIAAIYVFLLAPIVIIVFSSFNSTVANTFPPEGISLRWYAEFFKSDSFVSAFQFSIGLGIAASALATGIGFVTSYGIVRYLDRSRELGQSLAMLPIMIPHVLISISLLLLLTVLPIPEITGLLGGHTMICLPFTVAGILASLDGVDRELEFAASTLGASRLRVMWEVVIPLIAPGLLSAFIFAFIISFGDVYIALFLSAPGMTTLPIEIFSYMQWESTPVVAAITTVQILMIVVLGLVIERLVGLRQIMRI